MNIALPDHYKRVLTSKWAYLVYGLLISAFLILGIRYFTYHTEETHYHANFAVYINGVREEFKGPQYYEEVKICSIHDAITPAVRTHMHDEENGVIHVHDDAVTWGAFFANLGWTLGPDFVADHNAIYGPQGDAKLHIILNGDDLTDLSSIANQTIGNEDRLLLSYGTLSPDQVAQEYKTVPSDAHEYNHKIDPASCSGTHQVTPSTRLKHLF